MTKHYLKIADQVSVVKFLPIIFVHVCVRPKLYLSNVSKKNIYLFTVKHFHIKKKYQPNGAFITLTDIRRLHSS